MDLNQAILQLPDVLGLIVQFLRPDFLLYSLFLGYSLFFLSFFTHRKQEPAYAIWRDLDWGDRILIGLLIGGISLFWISSGIFSVLAFVTLRIQLVSQVDSAVVWVITDILVFVLAAYLRLKSGAHLYSRTFRKLATGFMCSRRGIWLVVIGPLLIGVYFWICSLSSRVFYGVTGNYVDHLLEGFLENLIFVYIVSLLGTIILLFAISGSVPELAEALSSYSSSLRWSLRGIVTLLGRNWRIVIAFVLVVFLGIFVPWSDSHIAFFVPKVQYTQTLYRTEGLSVTGSVTDYTVLISVEKDYLIVPASMGFIRNVTLPNPSNYSVNCCGTSTLSTTIIGSGVIVSPFSDSTGRLIAYDLFWGATSSSPFLFKLTYDDVLTGSYITGLVNYNFEDPVSLGNGTLRQKIFITLNGKLDKPLDFVRLLVRSVPYKIVSYTCTQDGQVQNGACLSMWNGLYIQNLHPLVHGSTSITVTLDYY